MNCGKTNLGPGTNTGRGKNTELGTTMGSLYNAHLPKLKVSPLAITFLQVMVAREAAEIYGGAGNAIQERSDKRQEDENVRKITENIKAHINNLPDEFKKARKNLFPVELIETKIVQEMIKKALHTPVKYSIKQEDFVTIEKFFLMAKKIINENKNDSSLSEDILSRKIHILLYPWNNQGIGETSALTALVNVNVESYIKNFITSLTKSSDENIIRYIESEYRKSISSMYSISNTIPSMGDIDIFIESCEEIYNENASGGKNDFKRFFSSITGMQNGRGVPIGEDIKNLVGLCKEIDESNWQGIFRAITGMQAGKGVPKREDIENLVSLCKYIDESNWQGIFSSITGMQHGKGVPSEVDITNLVDLCKKIDKSNWQGVFSSITGMQNGKGVPREVDIKNLVNLCNEIDESNWQGVFRKITGNRVGKGAPNKKELSKIISSIKENRI